MLSIVRLKSMQCLSLPKILLLTLVVFTTLVTSQKLTALDSVENITFSTPRLRHDSNPRQPYGKYLNVAFSAFGVDFNFQDMQLATSSIQNTDVEIHNDDGIEHVKMIQSTYRTEYVDAKGNKSYAIVTINPENDDILAVISQDNEKYYIQPRSTIAQLMLSDQPTLSHIQSSSNILAYKASEMKYSDEDGNVYSTCGAIDPRSSDFKIHTTDVDLNLIKNPLHLQSDLMSMGELHEEAEPSESSESSISPLSSSFERELNLKLWENCVPNHGITRYTLNVNFVADVGFFNIFKTQAATESYIQNMIVLFNMVYHEQMGINVHIGKMIVFQTLNSVPFNRLGRLEPGSTCSEYTINSYLGDLKTWARNDSEAKKYKGLWHALTNCYNFTTVGLAFVGSTCSFENRVGVSGHTPAFHELVLHELGHNMGSNHAWVYVPGASEGEVGGCMDYNVGCDLKADDPDNPGGYGFHRTSQVPICSHLTSTISDANNIGNSNESCWTSQSADTPIWSPSGWTPCSAQELCATGTRTLTFGCKKNGISVNDLECDGSTKPVITEKCTTGDDCTPKWHTSEWGACSSTDPCATTANKSRTVTCKRGDTIIKDSECTQPKPPLYEFCTPEGTCEADWEVVSWGACSSTTDPCVEGTRTRTVYCASGDRIVSNKFCTKTKPDDSETCTTGTCRGIWNSTVWGVCSSKDPCVEGTRSRTSTCTNPVNSDVIAEKFCTTEKPSSSESCTGVGTCEAIWDIAEWGTCSSTDSCIEGSRTRTVTCTKGAIPVEDKECKEVKPSTSEYCTALGTCEAVWSPTEWETCSSSDPCVEGTQKRTVICKSLTTDVVIANKYCVVSMPPVSQPCFGVGSCSTDGSGETSGETTDGGDGSGSGEGSDDSSSDGTGDGDEGGDTTDSTGSTDNEPVSGSIVADVTIVIFSIVTLFMFNI